MKRYLTKMISKKVISLFTLFAVFLSAVPTFAASAGLVVSDVNISGKTANFDITNGSGTATITFTVMKNDDDLDISEKLYYFDQKSFGSGEKRSFSVEIPDTKSNGTSGTGEYTLAVQNSSGDRVLKTFVYAVQADETAFLQTLKSADASGVLSAFSASENKNILLVCGIKQSEFLAQSNSVKQNIANLLCTSGLSAVDDLKGVYDLYGKVFGLALFNGGEKIKGINESFADYGGLELKAALVSAAAENMAGEYSSYADFEKGFKLCYGLLDIASASTADMEAALSRFSKTVGECKTEISKIMALTSTKRFKAYGYIEESLNASTATTQALSEVLNKAYDYAVKAAAAEVKTAYGLENYTEEDLPDSFGKPFDNNLASGRYRAKVSSLSSNGGKKSLHIKWLGSARDNSYVTLSIKESEFAEIVTEGETYTLSAAVKNIKTSKLSGIGGFAGWDILYFKNYGTNEWKTVEYSGAWKKSGSANTVRIVLQGEDEAELYVDDIVLKDKNGKVVWSEDFENKQSGVEIFAPEVFDTETEGKYVAAATASNYDQEDFSVQLLACSYVDGALFECLATDVKTVSRYDGGATVLTQEIEMPETKTGETAKIKAFLWNSQSEMTPIEVVGIKDELFGYANEINELILKCEAEGMSPDYEKAAYALLKKFAENGETLKTEAQLYKLPEYQKEVREIYAEAKANLLAYLNGEKTPLSVPKYAGGKIETSGTSILANAEVDGEIVKRPMFMTGYLGFGKSVWDELEFFSDAGLNAVQVEVSVANVFAPISAPGWSWNAEEEYDGSFNLANGGVSGESCLEINNDTDIDGFGYLTQTVSVEPNTTYEIGLKAKAEGLEKSGAVWFGANGLKLSGRVNLTESAEWKEYSSAWTTGPSQTSATFAILNEYGATKCFIDDVYMKKSGTDENLLANCGFEEKRASTKYDDEAAELGFKINYAEVDALLNMLENAEENNVMVDLNLSPHYMPKWIKKKSSAAANVGGGYMTFALNDEYHKKVISLWSRFLVSQVADSSCISSVCVTNEPGYRSRLYEEYYKPYWSAYLKEVHGNILSLNSKYGKTYTSFDDVPFPENDWTYTPLNYDYICFNEKLLAELHKFISSEIKKENTDLLLHTKIMQYFQLRTHQYYAVSLKWEDVANSFDVNGCDAYSFYDLSTTPMYSKTAWYDFMTSVKNAPVWDTESHILSDSKDMQTDGLISDYMGADVWNGGVHGRAFDTIWLWDYTSNGWPESNGTSAMQNPNGVLRPSDTAQVVRANLDLNRLAEEVTAIQQAKRNVGVLYSRTSENYVRREISDSGEEKGYYVDHIYYSTLGEAYYDAVCSGQKVGFVAESNLETMSGYPLVVVPEATHVPEKVLDALISYLDGGGKVLLLYDTALKLDEYGKSSNSAKVNKIYNHQNCIKGKTIAETVENMGLCDIKLVDGETGRALSDVEYSYAEYNGKAVVNIINYDRENSVKVKVISGGNEVTDMTELRSNEKIESGFELKPYQPLLIEF